jgi:hypothetical protein
MRTKYAALSSFSLIFKKAAIFFKSAGTSRPGSSRQALMHLSQLQASMVSFF